MRTLSFAAEARAREEKQQQEEEQRRREAAAAAAAAEQAKLKSAPPPLPPPLIPTSTILTPTRAHPTAVPTSNSSNSTSVSDVGPKEEPRDRQSKGPGDLKRLGEWSIREFEGDNFTPFDSASLEAINDLEVLQTISLVPVVEGRTGSQVGSSSATGIGQSMFAGPTANAASTSGISTSTCTSSISTPTAAGSGPSLFSSEHPPHPTLSPSSPPGVQLNCSTSQPVLPILPSVATGLTQSTSTPQPSLPAQPRLPHSQSETHTKTEVAAALPAQRSELSVLTQPAKESSINATSSPPIINSSVPRPVFDTPPTTSSPPQCTAVSVVHPVPASGNPFLAYPVLPQPHSAAKLHVSPQPQPQVTPQAPIPQHPHLTPVSLQSQVAPQPHLPPQPQVTPQAHPHIIPHSQAPSQPSPAAAFSPPQTDREQRPGVANLVHLGDSNSSSWQQAVSVCVCVCVCVCVRACACVFSTYTCTWPNVHVRTPI